jgi:hypothetical protein
MRSCHKAAASLENSFEQPFKVAPMRQVIKNGGTPFEHHSNSLTVVHLKAE